ncbi:MAG TPA: ABC transporter ATP-binding protein [Erysipelotrichaceae bacterium]|nr:MAG: hypothetical protein A2Y19_05545 [Firmicutes bacterium GWE2_51_13]HBZ42425.1 ABC transporter ATP-binding protein [Erysipelotrichaceae bacterium]
MINIRNISKSFSSNLVLNDISLKISSGEIVYIKGVNGSGKSTLLKIIAGILEPDTGDIQLDDGVYIGALIENPSFIENETALFNMKFLFNLRNKFDMKTVENLFNYFEIDIKEKKYMKDFSIGMRQKVGIIQAIMEDQNLVLFDEPTRGLDEKSTEVFVNIVHEMKKMDKTIVICAHDGVSLIDFDRRYWLDDGKIKEINGV